MEFKQRFAPEEWQLLKLLPLLVFNFALLRLMRERPQDMQTDQARMFFRSLIDAKPIEPMIGELMDDIDESEWPDLVAASGAGGSDVLALMEPLERIRAILARELSRREYNTFLGAVTFLAIGPFQGLSSEAKEVWVSALADLNKVLDIDQQAFIRSLRRLQERPG